jgi:hypothetical protein
VAHPRHQVLGSRAGLRRPDAPSVDRYRGSAAAASVIHERLVGEYGFTGRYQQEPYSHVTMIVARGRFWDSLPPGPVPIDGR